MIGRTTDFTCHVSPCVLFDWGESLAHRAQNEFSSPCQVDFSLCTAGSLHATKNANRHQIDITCISGKSFWSFDRGFLEEVETSLKAVVEPGDPGRCCWAAMRVLRKSILGSSEPALCAGREWPPADNSGGSLDPRLDPTPSACISCSCASDHTEGSIGAVLTRSFSRSARCLPAEPDTDRG